MIFYLSNKKLLHTKDCFNFNDNYKKIDINLKDIHNYDCKCNCIIRFLNLLEINKYCKLLNLKYEIVFDMVKIKTEISNWKFDIFSKNKIKLYHSNYLFMQKKGDYHIQFHKEITIKNLIYYIYYHDKNKWKLKKGRY